MNAQHRARATDTGLPAAERALIADRLRLALDEIESGAGDLACLHNAGADLAKASRFIDRRRAIMEGRRS